MKDIKDIEINNMINTIRQSISKILIDTSEENPLKCEIVIEPIGSVGLSSLLLPRINKIWQVPGEGWIRYTIEGNDNIREFDDLDFREMLTILQELEYLNDAKI